jgi:hypothetical protein
MPELVAALLAPEHIQVTNAQLREGNRAMTDAPVSTSAEISTTSLVNP